VLASNRRPNTIVAVLQLEQQVGAANPSGKQLEKASRQSYLLSVQSTVVHMRARKELFTADAQHAFVSHHCLTSLKP
jgi:hypothetical protein